MRPAVAADRLAVYDLVLGLSLEESLLQDLDCFYETCSDLVSQRRHQHTTFSYSSTVDFILVFPSDCRLQ